MTSITTDRPTMGALSRRDAAKYLAMSTRTLDKLAADGDLPRIKIGTKTVFRLVDLESFLAERLGKGGGR